MPKNTSAGTIDPSSHGVHGAISYWQVKRVAYDAFHLPERPPGGSPAERGEQEGEQFVSVALEALAGEPGGDVHDVAVQEVDVTAAVENALRDRTDLIAARKRLEITSYNERYFKNQTLPGLDARFDYNSTGIAGTQLVRDPNSPLFPPPVIGEEKRSYGDLLSDIFGFNFAGLFAPIDRPNAMNVSKAGQAIPLKWRLTDFVGNPVTTLASVSLTVSSVPCSYGSGTPDELEEYAAGSSGLQNLGDGYYQFNWKTPKTYAGSCKTLSIKLGPAEDAPKMTNLALFTFKK